MNPEIKAQWVNALRSGEYEQGKYQLHYQDGAINEYCCLGVLCDLAVKAGVDVHLEKDGTSVSYGDQTGALPGPVQEWAGLDVANPMTPIMSSHIHDYTDPHVQDSPVTLAELNDSGRMTFADIADVIEGYI